MIKAYNTELRRLISFTPDRDVAGRVIWANLFYGDKFVKTVNNVVPELNRTYATVVAQNTGEVAQQFTMRVEGRYLNQSSWQIINEWIIVVEPGEVAETYRRQYDRGDYRDVQMKILAPGADISIVEFFLSQSDIEVVEGLIIGGDLGEEIVVPCDFTGLTAWDDYNIVFEADGIGVIGKNKLILFNEDGYTTASDENDLVYFDRPSFEVDESLGIPVILNIATTSTTAELTHSIVPEATGYEYQVDDGEAVVITDNPFFITGLAASTVYNVRIRALRDDEQGDWSQVYLVTTAQASQTAPASAPVIGEIVRTTTTAQINFGGVSNADGYHYRLNGGNWVDIGNTNPFTASNLETYSTYLVEMRAYNSVGTGPVSDGTLFTTLAVVPTTAPTITDIDTTATEITVTFSTMQKVDGYEYSLNGGDPVEIDGSPHVIEGLTAGTSGNLRIRGFNPAGAGPWSDQAAYQMKQPPITAPTIDVEVSFDRVFATRSDVATATAYEYRFSIGNNVDTGLANPIEITGLDPETPYVAEFRAKNQWGNGPWSDPVEFTTRAILPPEVLFDEPEEAADVPQGDITVSGTVVVDFPVDVLEYRIDGGAWQALTADESFSFQVNITDLGAAAIEVRATDTNAGVGSETVNITIIDVTNPVPGGDGVLSTSAITDSGFTVGFTKATDNAYAQNTLVYKLYTGFFEVITDIDRIEDEGILEDQGTDVAELNGTGGPGQNIFGNVLVEDPDGNKALYNWFEVVLDNPDVASFGTTLTKAQEAGELIGNQFTGDVGDQLVVAWVIEIQDDADDEVTVQSLNEDVVTVESLTQTSQGEGSATLELQGLGEVDTAVVRVFPTFYGTWANTPVDKRTEIQLIRYAYEDDEATESATWTYTTGVA